jgi:hypothetical protein
MSDWIRTKVGLQMAEVIVRYLPRITICLEEMVRNQERARTREMEREAD